MSGAVRENFDASLADGSACRSDRITTHRQAAANG
jgi:hypothetical protein